MPDGYRDKRGATARGDDGSCPQVSGFMLRCPGDLAGNKTQPNAKKHFTRVKEYSAIESQSQHNYVFTFQRPYIQCNHLIHSIL